MLRTCSSLNYHALVANANCTKHYPDMAPLALDLLSISVYMLHMLHMYCGDTAVVAAALPPV